MISCITSSISFTKVFCGLQDCVCLIAPAPYNPRPAEDFDVLTDFDMSGEGLLWYGKLQLLFRCTLCPTGRGDARHAPLHKEVSLALISTFEPIDLTPDSVMQRQGVPMLYDTASSKALPSLYICPVKNILNRVPLTPSYIGGSMHNTIPYSYRRHDLGGAVADTREGSGNGSRLYEVNVWLWRYGRPQERKIPVLEAIQLRQKRVRSARCRGEATKRRRAEERAERELQPEARARAGVH